MISSKTSFTSNSPPSKGIVSQPFGSRSSGEHYVPPRPSDHGNDDHERYGGRGYDKDRYSDRGHDKDRWNDNDHDHDRHHGGHDWDDDHHGHDHDRYHGHKHHNCSHGWHNHGWHYPHYYSSIFLGYGYPAYHTHYIGCGHVGYWCEHCHFYSASVEVFYDHVHLSHGIVVGTIPTLLVWNPINLTFVFD